MYTDPQSVTIGTAQSLARTGFGIDAGTFSKDDQLVNLKINHTVTKRGNRRIHTVSLQQKKYVADPLVTGINKPVTITVRFVVDVEPDGFSISDQTAAATGLTTWLTASTNAKLIQLLGGES